MRKILWPLRIFHISIIFYYAIVLPLAIFGILAKYTLWNDINFYITLLILWMQAVWECPLTKFESLVLKEDKRWFVKRCFRRAGINLPAIFFTIFQASVMMAIIITYFIY